MTLEQLEAIAKAGESSMDGIAAHISAWEPAARAVDSHRPVRAGRPDSSTVPLKQKENSNGNRY